MLSPADDSQSDRLAPCLSCAVQINSACLSDSASWISTYWLQLNAVEVELLIFSCLLFPPTFPDVSDLSHHPPSTRLLFNVTPL